jgi:hypothetical protein
MRIFFAVFAAMPLASSRLVGWKKEVSRPDLIAFKKEVKTRIQLNFSERPNEEQLAKLRAAIVAEMGVSESELVSFTVQERVKGEHEAATVSIPNSADTKNLEMVTAQGSESGRGLVSKEEVAGSLQGSPEEDAAVKAALDDPAVTKSLNDAGLPPGVSPVQAAEWAAKNPEAMAAVSETLEDPAVQAAMTSGNPVAIAQAVAAHPEAAQCLALALLTAVKENPLLIAQLAQQSGVSNSLPASVPNFGGGGWQKEESGKSGKVGASKESFYLDEVFGSADLNGDKLLSKSEALVAAQLLGLSEDDVEAKFAELSPEQV